jgi:hypothetical protein
MIDVASCVVEMYFVDVGKVNDGGVQVLLLAALTFVACAQ